MNTTLMMENRIKDLEEEIKDLKETIEELIYLFVEHNSNEHTHEHKGIFLNENEEEAINSFKHFCSYASKEEKEEYIKRITYTATKIFPIYDKLNTKKIERMKEIGEILGIDCRDIS